MVGISSACFFPRETEKTLDIIQKLDVKILEVFLQAEYEYDPEFCKRLKDKADSYGMKVNSVHAFCRPFEPYLFSSYERRAQDCLNIFNKMVHAAKILQADYYTFHGDIQSATTDLFDYKRYASVLTDLCKRCIDNGIYLAWENVTWCQSCDPKFISRTLDYMDSSLIRFTLDLKQAKRAGISPIEYIRVMRQNLVTVHINDSDENHTCLLPGFGTFNYNETLSELKKFSYDGHFIIEVYPSDFERMEEISASIQFMENLLKNYRNK